MGLPPGVPGGGIMGMVPECGVGTLMPGSFACGGQRTPPDRASLSVKLPPAEFLDEQVGVAWALAIEQAANVALERSTAAHANFR